MSNEKELVTGRIVESTHIIKLAIAVGRAEIQLRKEHSELAKELVEAFIALSSVDDPVIFMNSPPPKIEASVAE